MVEKLVEILNEQLSLDGKDIKPESSFKDDLEVDSLDLFELVMAIEDEFGVEIPSEDLEKLTTIQSVMDYLKEKGVEE